MDEITDHCHSNEKSLEGILSHLGFNSSCDDVDEDDMTYYLN